MSSLQFFYRLVPAMKTLSSLLRGRLGQQPPQPLRQHKKKSTPKVDVYNLHPRGWESDPEDEYQRLCTLDYCSGTTYCAYALFFKLEPEADKHKIVEVLKQGLEITLSQCRRLCGILKEHPDSGGEGDLCFHKRRDDTVEFHVQWLDGANTSHGDDDNGDDEKYPSYADFERQHFSTRAFGPDLNLWCVAPMTPAEKPSNRPENNPKAASFKASFIPGDGLVLKMMHHHLANDVTGWTGELHQLAENCAAIWAASASGAKVASAATLPELPPYDAHNAYLLRVLLQQKARLHKSNPEALVEWVEAVDVRRRLCDASGKPMPARTQGNVIAVAIASRSTQIAPQFTIKEIIEEAPFSKLAWYIRQLTNSITPTVIDAMLSGIAHIRNKLTLYAGSDIIPPTTLLVTDWRDADPYTADFGFGCPSGFRCPWDSVTAGLVVIYPLRPAVVGASPGGEDEGNEISLAVEKELA
ncbi:hypothetical protein CSAL01_01191 [Colletotrichum salicis]|uniref:Trichothecene 3-O-acetyltransferase-like N-terminal domain-containing protein n=1 Tax=Colletotrichum salicis TaxID=1209931 RepID=A0A135SLS2_9PEZI|nr:hypothetical protein CSAL01_01191 [Colletotrichum salicis]